MGLILSQPTGRINVRGPNGAGKSTLLTSLKSAVKTRAYYWPTADRLAFAFSQGRTRSRPTRTAIRSSRATPRRPAIPPASGSCGRCRRSCSHTDAPIYLLDEWDANLDPNNRAAADALVEELARRARVVEISHRDRV